MQRNIRIQLEKYFALGFRDAHQTPGVRYLTKVIAIFINFIMTCELKRLKFKNILKFSLPEPHYDTCMI